VPKKCSRRPKVSIDVNVAAQGVAQIAAQVAAQVAAGPPLKPWFLYLIECADQSIYTGITVDVTARFAAHQSGKGARYTRSHPPLHLLGWFAYPDRSSAAKAEYQVKQLSAPEKRALAQRGEQASWTHNVSPSDYDADAIKPSPPAISRRTSHGQQG
jgi:putative endonuclease